MCSRHYTNKCPTYGMYSHTPLQMDLYIYIYMYMYTYLYIHVCCFKYCKYGTFQKANIIVVSTDWLQTFFLDSSSIFRMYIRWTRNVPQWCSACLSKHKDLSLISGTKIEKRIYTKHVYNVIRLYVACKIAFCCCCTLF